MKHLQSSDLELQARHSFLADSVVLVQRVRQPDTVSSVAPSKKGTFTHFHSLALMQEHFHILILKIFFCDVCSFEYSKSD